MAGLRIGNIEIKEWPLLLAPMEDVTEPSFRYMCKQFGADLMYTEFVASEAIIRNIGKSLKKLIIQDDERPIGIQLYGHNIEAMVESAKIATEANPDLIDINYGCPVRKIATRGAGAGMLQDIPKMIRMTEEIVKSTHLPVTVKTRLGWDENSIVIEDVAERLQDVGISALTIHARTRNQLYKGVSDWSWIARVKNNPRIKIPIIGNGDVDSPQKARQMFENYGVDAIMIGRATYGRPWIFKEIKHFLLTGNEIPALTVKEKVQIARTHFSKSLEWKGNPKGILEIRRHFSNYFKALPDFKETRLRLVTSLDVDEINSILNVVEEKWGSF